MRLVSLTAFPKSGVTYLSSLLFFLFFPEGDPSEIESVYIADIHINSLEGVKSHGNYVFFKSHHPFVSEAPWCRGLDKAIYLIRDPIDVMNSTFDFLTLLGSKSNLLSHDDFVETWVASKGDVLNVAGEWPHHVTSWMEQAQVPVLLIRYKDIVDDPVEELKKILGFLELPVDLAMLRNAVENSTMTAMRAREEEEFRTKRKGVFYNEIVDKGMAEGARFVNKGYRHSYEMLSNENKRRVDKVFGAVMQKYLK